MHARKAIIRATGVGEMSEVHEVLHLYVGPTCAVRDEEIQC